MINIGCDIGKSEIDTYINGKHCKFSNDINGIQQLIARCKEQDVARVVLEPTGGYERHLLKELLAHQLPVAMVNPMYVRKFAGSRRDLAKTDKIDAKILSEYGEKMEPRIYEQKAEFRIDLEALVSHRDTLVEMRKEERMRLSKKPLQLVSDSIKANIDYFDKQPEVVERAIENLIAANAPKESEALQTEKGIGAQTSAVLIAYLPELGRLDNRQIVKLAGLALMANDSGKKSGKRSIRGGRKRVRNALLVASLSAVKGNKKVKDFYNRLIAKGKLPKVVLTAVARKLLVILNSKMRLFREEKEYF
ncbi:IS110 family transposase [Alphaproteobacteria bacterium]|nr:IS110 family transposase [Alphaproteobacteria bacterium]